MNIRLHRGDELLTRRAPVTGNSYNAETRTFEAIAATETPVTRRDWGTGRLVREVLRIASDAVDMSRLNGAPILDSHRRGSTAAVVGVIEGARIERGQLVIRGRLSARDDVADVARDIGDGILRNVSVGYRIDATERTAGASGEPDTVTATRWTPLEVSLVAVPADPAAQIRAADRHHVDPAPAEPETYTPPASRDALLQAERQRVDAIRADGERLGLADLAEQAVGRGTSHADFRSLAGAVLVERETALANMNTNGDHMRVSVLRDGGESRRDGMTAAIVTRMAQASARPGERVDMPDHARDYAGMEMAAQFTGHRGQVLARDAWQVIERAFHTTSDFPAIFNDALNSRLLAQYQAAPASYRLFAARYMTEDFRAANVVRPGDFPALQPIVESGEIKSGSFGESKERIQVFPYGVTFNISRTMIVNDQLGAIDQVLAGAGTRVTSWENALMFALLLSGSGTGPTLLSDSTAVFHTNHGNLAQTPSDIDATNVALGFAAMAKQKSLDGLPLNLAPRILLCSPDKAFKAGQLLTTITPAQTSNAVPDYIRRITPVSDAAITGNPWYLFADPAFAPCFHYGYLSGAEGPRLSTRDAWSVQGVKVKLEHDFGVAATDFRGGYRNAGA
jgi:phage head maturation protease